MSVSGLGVFVYMFTNVLQYPRNRKNASELCVSNTK